MKNLLTDYLYDIVSRKVPMDRLNEIRLRVNMPIVLHISGKNYYLSGEGLTGNKNMAIVCTQDMLSEIIRRASEHSLYAINHQLKQGFITISGGIRVGIAGEVVVDNHRVKTIKNFDGINIRVPHEVQGCSLNAFNYIMQDTFLNTLIVSPPGGGKTTFIRDILYQLSNHNYCYNVLLVDERYEIANCFNGVPQLNVGIFTDVYSGCNKLYGFENGVRSMRPDIIATDELANTEDLEALKYVANCGVKVLSSVHAASIEELRQKPGFKDILDSKVFKRFVVLSSRRGPGTYEGIYDENLRGIYLIDN